MADDGNDIVNDFMILSKPLIPADAVAALIVIDGNRYLMQLRDKMRGIYYPGHWGLFGGAVDPGETPLETLHREMMEELQLTVKNPVYFTCFDFDFSFTGQSKHFRLFYEISIKSEDLPNLVLGEGLLMQSFTLQEILAEPHVVPYDSFALWLHANRFVLSTAQD